MAIKTRTLLVIITISLSILFLLLYIYPNDLSRSKQIKLSNKIKLLLDKSNNYLHDTIIKNIQTTGNASFMHAFIASISIIVFSEIGDKTFFMAAIMAMRHPVLIVYIGAMSALGAMTIISALLGSIVTKFIPRIYTYYLSSILFLYFGIKILKDGYDMSANEGMDEYEEVQHEVQIAEATNDLKSRRDIEGIINNSIKENQKKNIVMIIRRYISPIFIHVFIMTFLSEWGDRSQVTTMILAANENLLGVITGSIIGHSLCTSLAVIGGHCIAEHISPKTVTLVGGLAFLLFSISAFFMRPEK